MADNKKSFIVYCVWKEFLNDLTDAQLGKWLRWAMDYCDDKNPEYPTDTAVRMACKIARTMFKNDLEKYNKKVERFKKVGKQYRTDEKVGAENDTDNGTENGADIDTEIAGDKVKVNDKVNVKVNVKDKDILKEIHKEKSDTSAQKRASLFESFWNHYPRKIGKDKCKSWFQVRTRSITEELVNQMITAVEQQKKSEQWQKDGGQFIPHPYTWLNQGRWKDELEITNEPGETKEESLDTSFLPEIEY